VHLKRFRTSSTWMARVGGIFLAACMLAPLAAMAQAGAAVAPLGPRAGISGGSVVLWEPDSERVMELTQVANSGAGWFAMDIDWASVQPQRTKFNWAATDRVVLEAHARGLKILGIIAYSPKWARGPDCPAGTSHCLPQKAEDYARFAKEVAARYGNFSGNAGLRGTVQAVQVWNEPNHYPYVQKVNVPLYTYMLKQTYQMVKSVDWTMTVIAGGTSPAPDDPSGKDMSPASFLQAIYLWTGGGSFDAFGHHPYSFPCDPGLQKPWNAFQQTLTLRWIMAANGEAAKKIWATEIGAPTGADVGTCAGNNGSSMTEAGQALITAQYMQQWIKGWGSFTGPLILYMIRDAGTNPWVRDDNFGLVHRNFTAKPSYDVFRQQLKG
jgi:polysaccharide biosynthesis protein PslG